MCIATENRKWKIGKYTSHFCCACHHRDAIVKADVRVKEIDVVKRTLIGTRRPQAASIY